MNRVTVQAADVSGAPLDDLKQWLGITRNADDDQLVALLRASLEFCEAFTGQIPIQITCEETLKASTEWVTLSARPVRAITEVEELKPDNSRASIATTDYEVEISSDAKGLIRLTSSAGFNRIIVTHLAGIADSWATLPSPLQHGVIRLAAHHYLTREKGDENAPPAAVTALWRPWKQVRI